MTSSSIVIITIQVHIREGSLGEKENALSSMLSSSSESDSASRWSECPESVAVSPMLERFERTETYKTRRTCRLGLHQKLELSAHGSTLHLNADRRMAMTRYHRPY